MKKKENSNLNSNQEMYIEYLVMGYSQRKAYKMAYPESKNSKPSTIDIKAYTLFHKPEIQKRFNEVTELVNDEIRRKSIWTKERAIAELKDLLNKNVIESDRYEEAYDDEMELYDKQIEQKIEQLNNPKGYQSKKARAQLEAEIDELKFAKIRCNRRHQSNKSVNEAILSSILQLNQMMGFDKKEQDKAMKVEAQVSFIEDIPEEDEDEDE